MSKCSASSKAVRRPEAGIAGANGWQKRLDPQLDGLIEPTDPPKYWPHELEPDRVSPRNCSHCGNSPPCLRDPCLLPQRRPSFARGFLP